jgi:hypothetical protein
MSDVPVQSRSRLPVLLLAAGIVLGPLVMLLVNLNPATAQHDAVQPGPVIATEDPYPMPAEMQGVELMKQTAEQAQVKSAGCVHCHQNTGDPHCKATVKLGCCDCHGGNPGTLNKEEAHVHPRFPEAWLHTANPVRSYTLLNHERPDFIRFVNPGDLRIAHISCGTSGCHPKEVLQNRKSMMTHGCMLWGAALYNNGAVPFKWPRYGESYSMNGAPQRLQTVPPPSEEEMRCKGVLPFLDPPPRWEISQPGNILRIFERGGRFKPEIGIPESKEDPGRPILTRLSIRGLGTENRTDPTILGIQKTRLFDPTLNFMGTNDQPGDYRSSGCSACHIVYANDRSPVHSGPYAKYGNRGKSFSTDPTIRKDESGHPIAHAFAPGNSIPTSQCMVCHIHPGTTVMNSYIGYMWWDEESDGDLMFPKEQRHPSAEEAAQIQIRNPNESAIRNNLHDPEFVANLADLNTRTKHNQFGDFHSHGWAFRAVFKHDRKGNYLDHEDNIIPHPTNEQFRTAVELPALLKEEYRGEHPRDLGIKREGLPVHLLDIHMEKGMHCIDCHYVQDAHGNTKLQGEVRAAVEIQCIDCHGTITQRATLRTSGPASYTSSPDCKGRNLEALRTPCGKPRFERRDDKVIQHSMVEKDLSWEIKQTMDTINPKHPHYNKRAALAKTVRFGANGEFEWGDIPKEGACKCAHNQSNMTCIACHSSWNPSCYGCHLPQKANKKLPMLHNEGDVTRNHISYNFQTLRDDVYMLAHDGNVTCNRIGPSRSSCAVHVGSYNGLRESIYYQQQTISSEGMSGIAFSTNVPHTVRGRNETKMCSDCHLSEHNDNNAIMAQLLMHGTNYLNFMGRYCWVAAGEHGMEAVEVTERDEPQAVIGSTLHHDAFPEDFKKHVEHGRILQHSHEHSGKDILQQFLEPCTKFEILGLQLRGEYLYCACGKGGVRIMDVSFLDHKGFSERIFTAPVSPLGQKFYVPTKYCTGLAAPTTIAPDPTRTHRPENCEQKVAGIYGSLFVIDKEEGLIVIGAGTLLNGNPLDNFLKRDLTWNPDGILKGARAITIVGTYGYICCDAGLVVVNLEDPAKPVITAMLGTEYFQHATCVACQFRYAYVCDKEGIKVLDITNLAHPRPVSKLHLHEAHSIYLARTYAYVAGGHEGLIILDIENPEKPKIDQEYNAGGCINDLHDVKLGITYVSEFAYLADGKNGLRVVQLTSPDTPGNNGFSPRPTPCLIATYKLPDNGHALAISKAVDRDRAVDESGNQIAVFGRVGARPLNKCEQEKLYLRFGHLWKVSDDPCHPMYRFMRPLVSDHP